MGVSTGVATRYGGKAREMYRVHSAPSVREYRFILRVHCVAINGAKSV